MSVVTTRGERRHFDGVLGFCEHTSAACGGAMRFGVFLPPGASAAAPAPAVYLLAGLECNEETFLVKSGAARAAAALGLALVACDTSPRQTRLPGDDERWDFGQGAGFYVDATQAPWAAAYRMHTYVVDELPAVVEASFPVRAGARGVCGHSMGGHGALVAALRQPDRYRSVSAFAPIAAPADVPWGQHAFARYLGADRAAWAAWDTARLVAAGCRFAGSLLVDIGGDDKFLASQLLPERLEAACAAAGQPLTLRRRAGYDHSYWFVSTFVGEQLEHHARVLAG